MKSSENVAIFWDYENCSVPSNASGYAVANNIHSLSRPYGSVKVFRAYADMNEQFPAPRCLQLRSELQSSGISLVNCPRNGRKDVADKMILVDMLAYVIDIPSPSTIVLITGDRDFAYALSTLKLRGYRTVLLTLPNAHISLTFQASVCFDWFKDVVNPSTVPNLEIGSNSRQSFQHDEESSSVLLPSYGRGRESSNSAPANQPVDITQYLSNRTPAQQPSVLQSRSPFFGRSNLTEVKTSQPSNAVKTSAMNIPHSPPHIPHGLAAFASVSQESGSNVTVKGTCHVFKAAGGPDLRVDGDVTKELPSIMEETSEYCNNLGASSGPATESETSNIAKRLLADNPTAVVLNPSPCHSHSSACTAESKPPFETMVSQISSFTPKLELLGQNVVVPASPHAEIEETTPNIWASPIATSSSMSMDSDMEAEKSSQNRGSLLLGSTSNTSSLSSMTTAKENEPSTTLKKAAPAFETPAPYTIPVIFCPLFHSLEFHYQKGQLRPLRSAVGAELAKQVNLYQRAGVKSFKQYIALAEKNGMVTCGGQDGNAWVSFKPSWKSPIVVGGA